MRLLIDSISQGRLIGVAGMVCVQTCWQTDMRMQDVGEMRGDEGPTKSN